MVNIFKKVSSILLIIVLQIVFIPVSRAQAATAPGLGAAASFSVLGATSVTSDPISTLSGDLGVSPGTSIKGSYNVGGATHNNDSTAIQAQADLETAHGAIMAQGSDGSIGPALDGLTLTPGVYDIGAGRLNGGVLTLNGAGVYIFRASSDFVTSGTVSLINGATACNVFWDVTTLATVNGSTFVGTIIAGTGIHFGSGVTLDGRALARGGDVTLIGNTITGPTCSPSVTGALITSEAGASSPAVVDCPPIGIQVISPTVIESRRLSPTSIFISWAPYSGVNTFNVQYDTNPTGWRYGVAAVGFSTAINDLPANTNIWVRVAATTPCTAGVYGPAVLVGGDVMVYSTSPRLPNTGIAPNTGFFSSLVSIFSNIASFFSGLLDI
jgi:hypothetical protein